MEAKHTPGPWRFEEFELYQGAGLRFNISQAESATYTPHYSDVAQTISGEELSIQEANARLIAAAPELLAALQFYANPEVYKPDSVGRTTDLTWVAQEAIAKATT